MGSGPERRRDALDDPDRLPEWKERQLRRLRVVGMLVGPDVVRVRTAIARWAGEGQDVSVRDALVRLSIAYGMQIDRILGPELRDAPAEPTAAATAAEPVEAAEAAEISLGPEPERVVGAATERPVYFTPAGPPVEERPAEPADGAPDRVLIALTVLAVPLVAIAVTVYGQSSSSPSIVRSAPIAANRARDRAAATPAAASSGAAGPARSVAGGTPSPSPSSGLPDRVAAPSGWGEDDGGGTESEAGPAAVVEPRRGPRPAARIAAVRVEVQRLVAVRRFEEAAAVVVDAITALEVAAGEGEEPPQVAGLQALLAEIEQARAKHEAVRWKKRRRLIAKALAAQAEWDAAMGEIAELEAYLDHEHWAVRAIGALALGKTSDRRALGRLRRALEDPHDKVRLFALTALRRQLPQDIAHAVSGHALLTTLVEEMNHDRRGAELSREILQRVSGRDIKSRTGWKRWLADEGTKVIVESAPGAPDLSAFTPEEIDRARRELDGGPGRLSTVVGGRRARSVIEDLRKGGLEVAVCLDITGSMGHILDSAKEDIEVLFALLGDIVGQFRVGLVTYRDQVESTEPLSRSGTGIGQVLRASNASGGGDSPEGVDKALEVAVRFRWRKRAAQRTIVIVGDAPPRAKDEKRFLDLAEKARKDGITIDALYPSGKIDTIERAVELTGGRSAKLAKDRGFVTGFLIHLFGEELEPYVGGFVEVYLELERDRGR